MDPGLRRDDVSWAWVADATNAVMPAQLGTYLYCARDAYCTLPCRPFLETSVKMEIA